MNLVDNHRGAVGVYIAFCCGGAVENINILVSLRKAADTAPGNLYLNVNIVQDRPAIDSQEDVPRPAFGNGNSKHLAVKYNEATRLENRWDGNFVKKITPAREQNAAAKIELLVLGIEELDEAGIVTLPRLELVNDSTHIGICRSAIFLGP